MRTLLILITISCFSSHLSAQIPSYVPQNGLRAWWGFNGLAWDDSPHGNHALINTAYLEDNRFGNPNSSYKFDGSEMVFGHDPSLNLGSYTFSFWIKADTNRATGFILEKSSSSGGRGTGSTWSGTVIQQNNSGILFYSGTSNSRFILLRLDIDIPKISSLWNHVLMKGDSSTFMNYAYLNGVLVDSIYTLNRLAKTNANLIIGEDYKGILDDIGIWDRALTDNEIMGLYSATTGLWNFDNKESLKTFPNPFVDKISFELPEGYQENWELKIFDMAGRQIENFIPVKVGDLLSLDLGGLNKGVFFYHLSNGNSIFQGKIIKE